jgi:signal transduction histidine kinase
MMVPTTLSAAWRRSFAAGATLADRAFVAAAAVGVRTKILGLVIAVVCLLGLAVMLQLRAGLRAELRAGLSARGATIARDVAARAADLLLTDRVFDLHQLLRDTQRHDTDVRYLFVADETGRIAAHTFPGGVPTALISVNNAVSAAAPRAQLIETDEGLMTDIAAPILNGRKGVVRVGLSHKTIDGAILRASLRHLATVVICLIVGLGIALALTRVLTRPIVELVRVTRAVGRGDMTAHAEVFAADEIGELAVAFNSMTEAIARTHDDLRRRMIELRALGATASAFSGEHDLPTALGKALEAVMPSVNVTVAWVLLLSDGAPPWRLMAHRGLDGAPREPVEVESLSGCRCEQAATGHTGPVVEVARGQCWYGSGELLTPDATLACASLLADDRLVGVLYIALPPGGTLSDRDRSLLATVGRHLGVAVDNVRLSELARARERRRGQLLGQIINAQEAERKRLARDLHDEAGQVVTTLMLRLRTLEEHGGLDVPARRDVADAKDLARHLFDELHRLASELRPSVLDRLGLAEAVRAMVEDLGHHSGFATEVDAAGLDASRIPGHVQTAIYRIVQEAVSNVSRHARATHVSVLMETRDHTVSAVVEDNGVGFDVEARLGVDQKRPSLGLFGMQERAELLSGRVTLESTPGAGTTVFVEAPIEDLS